MIACGEVGEEHGCLRLARGGCVECEGCGSGLVRSRDLAVVK